MGGGIHGLNVDFLLRTSFEMAGPDAVQAPDSEDLTSVPGKAWLHDDIAFRKEAAASGLADWSRMNLDLFNFNSGSLSSNFCRLWNDGTYRWPFSQCRYRHSCEKCEGDHPRANYPFHASKSYEQHTRATTHLGTNTSGVEAVSRSLRAPYLKNNVNSVQFSRSISVSRSSYSVPVNVVVSCK